MRLVDQRAAADHAGHRVGDARAIDDRGRQHAVEAEHALEGERHQDEEQHAQQAGIEDRLEGVGARVLELRGVADGGLEAVGRPRGDEHAAEHQRPAGNVPRAGLRRIGAASGTSGEKFAQLIWPVTIGTTPTISIGMMTSRPMYFCTLAVPRMPRCWMAKMISISTAPMKKVALSVKETGPSVWLSSVQLRIAGVAAAATAAMASAALVPACGRDIGDALPARSR